MNWGREGRSAGGGGSLTRPKARTWVWIGVAAVAGIIVVVAWNAIRRGLGWTQWLQALANGLRRLATAMGPWGPLLLVGSLAIHSVVFFLPMEIPSLAALALYGSIRGVAIIWMGSMAAAGMSYALGWAAGPPLLRRFVRNPRVWVIQERVAELNPLALILLRWVSLVPFDVLNMVFGSCRVPMRRFAWTTGVGVLTTNVALALVYHSARHFDWAFLVGVFAVIMLAGWGAWKVARDRFPELMDGVIPRNSEPPSS
ncbi:MAG: VTT domain-containing protein [Thermaerobacter sp.]|nr:VTT domain-containing protein [Thermaerobacter sp.]